MLRNIAKTTKAITSNSKLILRNAATRKRFYKSCNVIGGNESYEIVLDQRRLKTPKGKIVSVKSQPLALAIAAEWDAQKENILQTNMHLTGLCFTALDNPDNLTEEQIANDLVNYLESDTILYFADREQQEELHQKQVTEWLPVTEWLCDRYHVNIRPTQDITGPLISDHDKQKIRQFFLSFDFWGLLGFRFSIETLKSTSLGLACSAKYLTVERATALSRLEEEFQIQRWGRVEWSHDLNEQSMRARVAAGTLFLHSSSSVYLTKTKRAAA